MFEWHPRDTPHEFTDEPAKRDSVIAGGVARSPTGRHPFHDLDHVVPIEHLGGVFELGAERMEASIVTEKVPNGQAVFAVTSKFGPVR